MGSTSVRGGVVDWLRYSSWNQALASVAEKQGAGGRPLYLELDEETIREAVQLLEEKPANPREDLLGVVRSTLDLDSHRPPFKAHGVRTDQWRPTGGQPPPCLALLYVCSAAAMEMRAGDGMSSSNYYGRLADLLGLDTSYVQDLRRGYMQHAERMWGALNRWLEHHEGEKGLPTAFALRHRYAGLPMSQALVRRADRARLSRFFAAYGFAPRAQMATADLEPILDDWIMSNPSPVSRFLRELWEASGAARERITAIVGLELSEWDGSTDLPEGSVRNGSSVRVIGRLRSFPRRRLALDLSVRLPVDEQDAVADVVDADDVVMHKVQLIRAGDGSFTVAPGDELDSGSLLNGITRLRWAGGLAQRKPRLVVLLTWDDLLQGFVETTRAQLGQTSLLLVPSNRREAVLGVLRECAAPGWEELVGLEGVPDGWVAFAGVEIYARFDQSKHRWVELEALMPFGGTQLSLAGGLRLPGKIRKWSTFRPPEVRAVLPEAQTAEVTVRSADGDWSQSWSSDEGLVLVDLSRLGLSDGDFVAQLRVGGRDSLVAEAGIRLRSADRPAQRVPATPLGYTATGVGAFSAQPGGTVRGATVGGELGEAPVDQPLPPRSLPVRAASRAARSSARRPALVLSEVRDDSCALTGAHHWQLPPALDGKDRGWMEGTCRRCGLVKRYPRWHVMARKRRTDDTRGRSRQLDLSRLRPVQARSEVDWQVGFDALCHLGRGSISELERVALQLEASSLFVDEFIRGLMYLGHLDVQRHNRSWRVQEWEVAPSALAGLVDGSWFLCGWRSERLVYELATVAGRHGVRVEITTPPSGPDSVILRDVDAAGLTALLAESGSISSISVHEDVAEKLLRAVPPLARVAAAIPRVPMGEVRKVEVWDPESATWSEEDRPRPGFLRLHGVVRTYCMVTTGDLGDGVIRPMTPQLLKHVAGALCKRPLVAWDPERSTLAVPLGCDLPGLLGRAVTLCSGTLPRPSEGGRALIYADVPERIARHVYALCGGVA